MAARRLGENERHLWLDAMRAVSPLRGRPPLAAAASIAPAAPAALPGLAPQGTAPPGPTSTPGRAPGCARAPVPTPFRPPLEIGRREGGLDDTSWRMLGSGRLRPQRRLDLHGQQAQAAFHLLHGFLLRARDDRLRCVEIITGAGSGPDGGVLRRELPHWLSRADLRPMVLAAVHPHRRNVGSVRLLLRRRP